MKRATYLALIVVTLASLSGCAGMSRRAARPGTGPSAEELAPPPETLVELAEAYVQSAMENVAAGNDEDADQAMESALEIICHGQDQYPESEELQSAYCWILEEVSQATSPLAFQELLKDELPDVDGASSVEGEVVPPVLGTIPREMNGQVENVIKYFTKTKASLIARSLSRGSAFMPMIRESCRRKGLPEELAFLPLIESAYNTRARSYARANGMWQFIASTGRLYGLDSTWWYDERLDPVKSTEAALEHLKDLYESLGSWHLALAAYNAGEGRVRRAVERAGTTDFWEISRRKLLPKQTRGYVPAFIAAVLIGENPEAYGLTVETAPEFACEVVPVDAPLELGVAARCAGVPVELLADLNPEILRGVTPPDMDEYGLNLPSGCSQLFVAELAKVPREERVVWKRHVVRSGDTLYRMARRYGTSIDSICAANQISRKSALRVGQSLVIPSAIDTGGSRAARAAECGDTDPSPPAGASRIRHRIRSGDTLGTIARRYGVTVEDLRRWNNLRGSRIVAGRGLWVYTRGAPPAEEPESSARPSGRTGQPTYTVRSGDSLWTIARRHGVTVEDLRRWNGLGARSLLHPGRRLVVRDPRAATREPPPASLPDGRPVEVAQAAGPGPAGSAAMAVQAVYTVRPGDSLWKIARAHRITVEELMAWNSLDSRTVLDVGQELLVSSP